MAKRFFMKSAFPKFLKNLLLFSVLLGVILFVLSFFIPAKILTPTLPFQFFFFVAITILVSYILFKASGTRFPRFLNIYMLVTVLKLFLFFLLIMLYVSRNRQDALAFTVTFFLLYISFSIFEVVSLISFFKKMPQSRV